MNKMEKLQEATILALQEESIDTKSNYYEILDFLEADPDSPFAEEEVDIIKDIMVTYPNYTSKEIADIYNEYCETGIY